MSKISEDLRAAADKLHEARGGGDEVAIQCVEQLRRHADTIERVEQEMSDACTELQELSDDDMHGWIDALRGETT